MGNDEQLEHLVEDEDEPILHGTCCGLCGEYSCDSGSVCMEEDIPCQGTCTERGVCTCSFAKFNNKE